MLRRVGFHEEYDGVLIARLIQVMNSDDLGNSGPDADEGVGDEWAAMRRMGWYAASLRAAAALGGAALGSALVNTGRYEPGNPDRMPIGVTEMGMKLVSRDEWFGLIADRLAELIKGRFGMSEEFLVRHLRDDARMWLARLGGDTAKWDDRVALLLSDEVIARWRVTRPA
jgi:hypothetical protein